MKFETNNPLLDKVLTSSYNAGKSNGIHIGMIIGCACTVFGMLFYYFVLR